jgi:hypothetical protein
MPGEQCHGSFINEGPADSGSDMVKPCPHALLGNEQMTGELIAEYFLRRSFTVYRIDMGLVAEQQMARRALQVPSRLASTFAGVLGTGDCPVMAGSRAAGRHCVSGLVQVCCDLASASRAFRNRRSGPVPARAAASS